MSTYAFRHVHTQLLKGTQKYWTTRRSYDFDLTRYSTSILTQKDPFLPKFTDRYPLFQIFYEFKSSKRVSKFLRPKHFWEIPRPLVSESSNISLLSFFGWQDLTVPKKYCFVGSCCRIILPARSLRLPFSHENGWTESNSPKEFVKLLFWVTGSTVPFSTLPDAIKEGGSR